jgi:16S rRNA G966 N2-methylase RsmD
VDNKDFIKKHLNDDVNKLALSKLPEGIDRDFVIRQIQARQLLKKKLPSWAENDELIFPKKLSLEQCSSEYTARYKSSLIKGKTLIDLTGGMGVDTAFLSDNFDKTYYVEMQEELCEIAKHNFQVLNKNIEVVNDNAEHFLTTCDEVDCIYLDPARRDEYGRKMVSLHDCSPDVAELHDILLRKAKRVLVKVSPMLDIEMIKKELTGIAEIHVVAVRNECKEILVVLGQQTENSAQQTSSMACGSRLIAIDLRENWNFTLTEDEEHNAEWTLADAVGRYLYEPGVACMKAAPFKLLSQKFNIKKLHRNSHLYTSDDLVPDFPGRVFEVLNVVPFDKKTKKSIWENQSYKDAKTQRCEDSETLSLCYSTTSRKASVAVRNFPLSAEELKKNLGLQDGDDFYIFGTTMKGEKKIVVLAKKV